MGVLAALVVEETASTSPFGGFKMLTMWREGNVGSRMN